MKKGVLVILAFSIAILANTVIILAQADLIITNAIINPSPFNSGDTIVNSTVTIKNIGDASAEGKVRITIGYGSINPDVACYSGVKETTISILPQESGFYNISGCNDKILTLNTPIRFNIIEAGGPVQDRFQDSNWGNNKFETIANVENKETYPNLLIENNINDYVYLGSYSRSTENDDPSIEGNAIKKIYAAAYYEEISFINYQIQIIEYEKDIENPSSILKAVDNSIGGSLGNLTLSEVNLNNKKINQINTNYPTLIQLNPIMTFWINKNKLIYLTISIDPNNITDIVLEYLDKYPVVEQTGELSCTNSDEGLDYYNSGEATNGITSVFDLCLADSDNILVEGYCNNNKLDSIQFTCPFGCENGACIQSGNNRCTETDSGLDIYTKGTTKGPWLNDINGDVESGEDFCSDTNNNLQEYNCEQLSSGSNIYGLVQTGVDCINGCSDGACSPELLPNLDKTGYRYASWKCQDGESFNSQDDTSCKLAETWEKYAEEFCKDRCAIDGDNKKCGIGSYGINVECYYDDEVLIEDKKTNEYNKDIKDPEIINDISICKNSCSKDNKCYPFGYRKSGEYCSDKGVFNNQLDAENTCNNNFECSSNLCIDSQCVSSSLWQKFLAWFSRFFGYN